MEKVVAVVAEEWGSEAARFQCAEVKEEEEDVAASFSVEAVAAAVAAEVAERELRSNEISFPCCSS